MMSPESYGSTPGLVTAFEAHGEHLKEQVKKHLRNIPPTKFNPMRLRG
eukprot:SAG22_NODE_319_length_12493_cov_33.326475_12_plen_48_part_00